MALLPFRDELVATGGGSFVYYGDSPPGVGGTPAAGNFNQGDLFIVVPTSAATPGAFYPSIYRCTTASSANNGGTWTAIGCIGTSGSTTLTAGASISPTTFVSFVNGATAINTIVPPAGMQPGMSLVLIGGTTTTISGNIALASSLATGKANEFFYNGTSFYPSY